jgi:hypothetical protein
MFVFDMKIVALHGYTQSAMQFQKKIAVLSKGMKSKGIDCVFVEAPHRATTSFKFDNPQPEERAWWNATSSSPISYLGLTESIHHLKETIGELPEGVLGFSQGAMMGIILASILNPKFAIIISGFLPRDEQARILIQYKGRVLFVAGEFDLLVPLKGTIELAKFIIQENGETCLTNVIESGMTKLSSKVDILVHDGGHVVPQKAEYKKMILDWVTVVNKM